MITKVLCMFMAIALLTGPAFAGKGGGFAPAVGHVNVPLTVPKAAKAECKSVTTGNAGSAFFNVSTTTMVNWKATTSDVDSTAVVVKRHLNSNSAYFANSTESNLPVDATVSRLTFSKYSTQAGTGTPRICIDRN